MSNKDGINDIKYFLDCGKYTNALLLLEAMIEFEKTATSHNDTSSILDQEYPVK